MKHVFVEAHDDVFIEMEVFATAEDSLFISIKDQSDQRNSATITLNTQDICDLISVLKKLKKEME